MGALITPVVLNHKTDLKTSVKVLVFNRLYSNISRNSVWGPNCWLTLDKTQHRYWLNRHGTHSEKTQGDNVNQVGPEIQTLGNWRSSVYMLLRSKDGVSPLICLSLCLKPRIYLNKKKKLITHQNKNILPGIWIWHKYLTEIALCLVKVLKGSTFFWRTGGLVICLSEKSMFSSSQMLKSHLNKVCFEK